MLSLQDMVANQSISAEGADILRTIGAAGRAFLVHARPRNAGKTTLTQAIVAEAPVSVPRHDFYGTEREVASLSAAQARGYLVVGEIGHRGRPGYLAGAEVVRLFELLAAGYSVASSLHADSVDEVFDVLQSNGVDRAAVAAAVPYLIKIRVLGDPDNAATRRVVEQIYEIAPGASGPAASLLYEWDALSTGTPPS